jgi:ABC-type Mn2+/Zn2+ transport system permease subunit
MSSNSFSRMLRISTVLGASAGAIGMYLSYQLEIPSGTTIVLVNALAFLAVLAVTGRRGLRRAAGLDDHSDLPTPAPLVGAGR